MKQIPKLAKDAAVLTGASLLMRCIGLSYQVWLAGRIGASGIGLWQLVLSVSSLAATLAISGIRFTATRLISEVLGSRNAGPEEAVKRCLIYALCFGCAAFALLYFGAEAIGFIWVGDARTVRSLRIIAFTMPMISLSCVLNGYFVACGQAGKSAAVQVVEQLSGVGCVILLLSRVGNAELELCCAAVSRGNLIADAVSLLLVSVLYLLDRRKRERMSAPARLTGRMLRIAVPLAFSAYARVGLTTLENLLVPRKLRAAGFSADSALSGYGTITGMVFPIIGFPSCLLSAVAELTVPELTRAQVQGRETRIRSVTGRLLRSALGFSLLVAAGLFLLSEPLGRWIYHSDAVGRYIRIFAPLIPAMYMDIVTDGCLKGLGQMLWSMGFNVAEAVIGVVLVCVILPRYGLGGYIFVLYFCELFNFSLSILRLKKVAGKVPATAENVI